MAVAVATLLTTSCSFTALAVEHTSTASETVAASTGRASGAILPAPSATATATPSATATATATPSATATPAMTATATATPDLTATAMASLTAEWSANTQQVIQIDSALATIGRSFQNGSMNTSDAASRLQQLDQQAGTVGRTIDGLPPLPGVDAATLGRYHQTVDEWMAAIHDLDVKVADNDIFGAPGAVNHLEQVANDLEQQTANLKLQQA